jgi:hypothetical protein
MAGRDIQAGMGRRTNAVSSTSNDCYRSPRELIGGLTSDTCRQNLKEANGDCMGRKPKG